MEFKKFIKRINIIYNIIFLILFVLFICGVCEYYYLFKNNLLVSNSRNTTITVVCASFISIFTVYFALYIFRFIYNKMYLSRLNKNGNIEEIEIEFKDKKYKKGKIIVTENYIIIAAYKLKVIRLEDIKNIYFNYHNMYGYSFILNIICNNKKKYTINKNNMEEELEKIKPYINSKNPLVSYKYPKEYEKTEDKQIIMFGIISVIIILILCYILR